MRDFRKTYTNKCKKTAEYSYAEKSDILFYLLYGVVANKLRKNHISVQDIKNFDVSSITKQEIDEMKDKIYSLYKSNGGNGRVAKSTEFVNKVDGIIGLWDLYYIVLKIADMNLCAMINAINMHYVA